jgi:sugar lactone lactonase YvrE
MKRPGGKTTVKKRILHLMQPACNTEHNFFPAVYLLSRSRMKFCVVFVVLVSVVGRAFSQADPPMVSTIYSGTIAPAALWSDSSGNIYGCEPDFHSVFKVTSGGAKTNFAGTYGTSGVATEGVLAVNALFNTPRTVWSDSQCLYVTDSVNNRIRRISWATSLITTVVGGGTGAILTSGTFLGTSVVLPLPNAIAGSSNGKIYFANFDHIYLLIPNTGMVSFLAGGDRNGAFAHGDKVSLSDIQGLAVDPTNQFLFVAESGNKVVRKMDLTNGAWIIFAGKVKKENVPLPSKIYGNGETADKMVFGNPTSVWVDQDGSVFIADYFFHIVSVVRNNKIYLFAGKWKSGAISNTLMTGPATQVEIEARYIFGDSSKGALYLSDKTRGGIQKITSGTSMPTLLPTTSPTEFPTITPTVTPTSAPTEIPTVSPTVTPVPTLSPTEAPTFSPTVPPIPLILKTNFDYPALSRPLGLWVDTSGNIYVTDAVAAKIYKQSAAGAVSTFAGTGTPGIPGEGVGDGGLATEALLSSNSFGLWGDAENLYVYEDNRLRVINFASNFINTVAVGEMTTPAFASTPSAIWGDGMGNIYIASNFFVLHCSVSAGTLEVFASSTTVFFLAIAGDVTRNCLYVAEYAYAASTGFVIRAMDLTTKATSILAGEEGATPNSLQYTDGAAATSVSLFTNGLWVADDGTVFVAHGTIVSAIDPVTQTITWVGGTWKNGGPEHIPAGDDPDNLFMIGGPAKLGKIVPVQLAGNSQLSKLYLVDDNGAVRLITPISSFLASSSRRKLEEDEHGDSSNSRLHTRNSSYLRGGF